MSSYIPTVASSVTRSVDEAISTTLAEYGGGSGAQNWFLHSAGTVVSHFYDNIAAGGSDQTLFTMGTGAATPYISTYNNSSTDRPITRYHDGTSLQIDITQGTNPNANATNKITLAYAANNAAVAYNGGSPTTDATVSIAASGLTQFNIGTSTARASTTARGVKEFPFFAFYPARISNSELTRITT